MSQSPLRRWRLRRAPVKVANAVARKSIGPDRLWQAVEGVGYLDVLAAGASGMVEAATILRAAGHHAARIPLGETMLARWLCAACGLEAAAGRPAIRPVGPGGGRPVPAAPRGG